MAIVAMASDKQKMAKDKMKLYLKFKPTFGPDGYFRKAHTHISVTTWISG